MTDSERKLWACLKGKQLFGIQFYRQKPIGEYIVDFYAPKAKLVIEVDGSQHFTPDNAKKDQSRNEYLKGIGLQVLRFNNLEVLNQTDEVVAAIYKMMDKQLDI
jgi:very-short-patch-repair endonuclease